MHTLTVNGRRLPLPELEFGHLHNCEYTRRRTLIVPEVAAWAWERAEGNPHRFSALFSAEMDRRGREIADRIPTRT